MVHPPAISPCLLCPVPTGPVALVSAYARSLDYLASAAWDELGRVQMGEWELIDRAVVVGRGGRQGRRAGAWAGAWAWLWLFVSPANLLFSLPRCQPCPPRRPLPLWPPWPPAVTIILFVVEVLVQLALTAYLCRLSWKVQGGGVMGVGAGCRGAVCVCVWRRSGNAALPLRAAASLLLPVL